ncbi:MAG: Hsp70 family protein, partial [Planctomycetaceae bacterium]|nr:Hsp70 family protein [Planctomycetaceae bacterium]
LLPEPTAAAIAIGLDKGRDQTILVYDLGGGTFDISVLKIENESFAKFTVLAVNGDHDLGGNDFDSAIREHAIEEFLKQHRIDLRKENPTDSEVRHALQMLTSACERVKVELSDAEEAYLDLPNFYKGKHLEMAISRRTFEGLIKGLVYKTKDLVLATIREAKLDIEDIDRLVLVGGSTKVPLIRRVLADTVKEPFVADNVDLAVSQGAAIMAANLCSVDEVAAGGADYAPVEIDVTDVVSHPISVGMNDERNQLACTTVIQKNSPLPSSGMTLGVASPGQIIGQLPVFRGDNPDPEKNHYLGMLTLTFDKSRSHTFIRFELCLDPNGVLQVEGATIDLEGRDASELLWMDPATLKVVRKVRAELKISS